MLFAYFKSFDGSPRFQDNFFKMDREKLLELDPSDLTAFINPHPTPTITLPD